MAARPVRLPPDVNRFVYVKNLPFKITAEEIYDLFGQYGAIRQVRLGNKPGTRGKAFVVYEDIHDAKQAVEKLSGFNLRGLYINVHYHKIPKEYEQDVNRRRAQLERLKQQYALEAAELASGGGQ